MNIRKMTISDYDGVYNLGTSCAGMGLNNLDDSRDGIGKFINRNPDTCLVAEEDSRIVGVIMAGNDGSRGYIYHTAVNQQYRKKSIAKQLVDKAVTELELQGFTVRGDLIYRNKALTDIVRIDT